MDPQGSQADRGAAATEGGRPFRTGSARREPTEENNVRRVRACEECVGSAPRYDGQDERVARDAREAVRPQLETVVARDAQSRLGAERRRMGAASAGHHGRAAGSLWAPTRVAQWLLPSAWCSQESGEGSPGNQGGEMWCHQDSA